MKKTVVWSERQKEFLKNVSTNEDARKRYYNDAAFLSSAMDDDLVMRELIHRAYPAGKDILKIFYKYSFHNNRNQVVNEFQDLIDKGAKNDDDPAYLMGYFNVKNGTVYGGDTETPWITKPEEYNIRRNQTFYARGSRFEIEYKDMSVKDVLTRMILVTNKHEMCIPNTMDPELDLLLAQIYELRDSIGYFGLGLYESALKKFNANLIKYYNNVGGVLPFVGYSDAAALINYVSERIMRHVPYEFQRGWYHSDLGAEMLKFSYLTSFVGQTISEQDMNDFVNGVKGAGHWLTAVNVAAYRMVYDAKDTTGINYAILSLAQLRDYSVRAARTSWEQDRNMMDNHIQAYINAGNKK